MPILETIPETINRYQHRVEETLQLWLPETAIAPATLHEAMRYSTLSDGKRIRPVLVYATGEALGVPLEALDGPACSVELIHAYSLVHDDLPAMDDDDLRRGKPTCHRQYDEATAILAGDALQALAFYILAQDEAITCPPRQRLAMIAALAHAAGSTGMAGGQALDLDAVGQDLSIDALENIHSHKTGALIQASVRLGALACDNLQADVMAHLDEYSKAIGLAFQVQDDILDVEGETEVIGKPRGSDLERDKPTYPKLLGLDEAKKAAAALVQYALGNTAVLGERAGTLNWIANYITGRKK